jgi:hypothetical protein
MDTFIANYNAANKVWINDGSGTFSDSGQSLGGASDSYHAALGDLDGDGDLDAFVVNNNHANKVWTNDGSGTFSDSGQTLGSASTTGLALGDLDGDGDLDAFATTFGQSDRIWTNDGSGTFTSGQSIDSSSVTMGVALGDLDGDGDLDAYIANYSTSQSNKVWINNGSGSFSDSGQSLGSSVSYHVALGDLDGDGDLDAFVANHNAANKVWTNDGSGTFTDSGQSLGSSSSLEVVLGDLDEDGDLDAYVACWGSKPANKIWTNDGSGTFTQVQNLGSSSSTGAALGDLDGDGDLDAFVSNSNQANKVWTNQSGSAGFTITDTSPGSYIPNSIEDDLMQVIFTHNGIAADPDLELSKWELELHRSDCSTALTSSEANAFIDSLRVRLDDGDGVFETDGSDALVSGGDISTLSLTDGVQTVVFANDDINVQTDQDVAPNRTYWISILTTNNASSQTPNNFCLVFDPDAHALVEGKTPDFSVSIQDTEPTETGDTPTAVTLRSFSIRPGGEKLVLLAVIPFIFLIGMLIIRKKRR